MYPVFDNGHGGVISGKYVTKGKQFKHPNGKVIYEGVFNRIVVDGLVKLCKQYGMPCEVLVPELQDITLGERVRRANNIYKRRKDAVLISIHANAGGGSGFEVFTSVGQTKSDKIAESLIDKMTLHLSPALKLRADTRDGDKDKEAHFYILRETKCPAVLVECAFMDTYEPDCKMMLENPEIFINAIFEGIKAF